MPFSSLILSHAFSLMGLTWTIIYKQLSYRHGQENVNSCPTCTDSMELLTKFNSRENYVLWSYFKVSFFSLCISPFDNTMNSYCLWLHRVPHCKDLGKPAFPTRESGQISLLSSLPKWIGYVTKPTEAFLNMALLVF